MLVFIGHPQLLPDHRGGRPESSLSPPTWRGDPLPTPGPGESDLITPVFQSVAGTTVALLLRGTGCFSLNHLRESLNAFIHTGGPRRGHSFHRRFASGVDGMDHGT
jgi:hypothetical protein